MSHEPHARTDETTAGSVPSDDGERTAGTQAAMSEAPDPDRSEVPPQGSVPDDLAEAGEAQLKEGMSPGGRVAGAGDGAEEDPMHGGGGASGTPGATDRS